MRVDPSYITNLVSALDQAQANEQQYSSELSSGVRVTTIGTDPVAAGENVLLLNQINQDDSFTTTADQVTGQLQVADTALGSVISQLTQAISLSTGAINGTYNSSNENTVANELQGILGEVTGLANTVYQGQYIFSGSLTSTQPFDSTGAYSGDTTVNSLVTPNNQSIQLNVAGSTIFNGDGDASKSVFAALSSLISDFSSVTASTPLDAAQASTDLNSLNQALNWVSQQRVTIDNSINQVSSASSAASSEAIQLTAAQTDIMQANVATVSTQLALSETQQTALESVIAQLGSGSLFDKLQY